jgi:hypothetical protein
MPSRDPDDDDFRPRPRNRRRRKKPFPTGLVIALVLLAVLVPFLVAGAYFVAQAIPNSGGLPTLAGPRNAQRLLGKWEMQISQGGLSGRGVYEYRADGSASVTVYRGGQSLSTPVRWEVLGESGDTIKLRVSGGGMVEERTIQFLSNDEYQDTAPGKPVRTYRRIP